MFMYSVHCTHYTLRWEQQQQRKLAFFSSREMKSKIDTKQTERNAETALFVQQHQLLQSLRVLYSVLVERSSLSVSMAVVATSLFFCFMVFTMVCTTLTRVCTLLTILLVHSCALDTIFQETIFPILDIGAKSKIFSPEIVFSRNPRFLSFTQRGLTA